MPKNSKRPLFARNLAFLRYERGMTAKKVSELTGIPKTTWWSWEYGTCYPSLKFLPKICQALEYYDLYSMVTVDLSIESPGQGISVDQAMRSVNDLKKMLENIKN